MTRTTDARVGQPGEDTGTATLTLIVLYTEQLEACRAFYTGLGLQVVRERHGSGPVHYAAELGGGLVLELYPSTRGRATGRCRIGLTVPAGPDRAPGQQQYTDPDGRTVVLQTMPTPR